MDRERQIDILTNADEAKARAVAWMDVDAVREAMRMQAEAARELRPEHARRDKKRMGL